MQRPWLAHYPAGVPAEIGHDYPRTLAQLIEEALERYAERTAVTFLGGTSLTGNLTTPRARRPPG